MPKLRFLLVLLLAIASCRGFTPQIVIPSHIPASPEMPRATPRPELPRNQFGITLPEFYESDLDRLEIIGPNSSITITRQDLERSPDGTLFIRYEASENLRAETPIQVLFNGKPILKGTMANQVIDTHSTAAFLMREIPSFRLLTPSQIEASPELAKLITMIDLLLKEGKNLEDPDLARLVSRLSSISQSLLPAVPEKSEEVFDPNAVYTLETSDPQSEILTTLGTSRQLRVVARSRNGEQVPLRLLWSSTNPQIVSVDQDGTIRPRNVGGPVGIEAKVSGSTQMITFVYRVIVKGVTIAIESPQALTHSLGNVGDTLQLTASPVDADGTITNDKLTWTSDDPETMAIDQNGLLQCLRRNGGQEVGIVASVPGTDVRLIYIVTIREPKAEIPAPTPRPSPSEEPSAAPEEPSPQSDPSPPPSEQG